MIRKRRNIVQAMLMVGAIALTLTIVSETVLALALTLSTFAVFQIACIIWLCKHKNKETG